MEKTRICGLLGIEFPIIQGGMLWLAAAVSESGALGIVSPMAGMEKHGEAPKNLRQEIRSVREMTKKSFGVNIPLDLQQSGRIEAISRL